MKRTLIVEVRWKTAGHQAFLHPVKESKHRSSGAPVILNCTHWPMKKFWKDGDSYPGEGMHWLDVPTSEMPQGTLLKITVERVESKEEKRRNTRAAAAGK